MYKVLLVLFFCAMSYTLVYGSVEEKPKLCFGLTCFDIEIADDDDEHAQGLMGRSNLDEDDGMLFVFKHEEQYGMWMKNTLIPLDIIWLDEDGVVVHFEPGVQPCQKFEAECDIYQNRKEAPAKYVLELAAGSIHQHDINLGRKAKLPEALP